VGHETAGLTQTVERPSTFSGAAFEKYDFRNGNDGVGQGYLYRGQGDLQLTGKANYEAVNDSLGLAGTPNDIVQNPGLVGTSPELSARTAGAYWAKRKDPETGLSLNETADQLKGANAKQVAAVTREITRGINPGELNTNTKNANTNKVRSEATADRINRTKRALKAVANCSGPVIGPVNPGPTNPGQGVYAGEFIFNGLGEFFGQSKGTMTVDITSVNGETISGTLSFTNLAGANRSGAFTGMITGDATQNFTGTADGVLGGASVTFIGTLSGNTVTDGRLASGAGDGQFTLTKA
jgi:predicted chitinase